MSYILDALKKSEKERKRGKVPDVLTVQEQLSYERRKRNIWPYLITIALLINAGILIWWTGLSPNEKPVTPGKPVTAQEVTNNTRTSSLDDSMTPLRGDVKTTGEEGASKQEIPREKNTVPAKSDDRSLQGMQAQQPLKKDDRNNTSQENIVQNQSEVKQKFQDTDTVSQSVQPGEVIPKPEPNKLYIYKELPEGIRKNLPPLSLSIALYSDDPATRIARIDGQTLREGQELKPGLKLEQIVEHGAILSYQNYRFRIGIK
jgi:general secretion pathway protein B